MDDKTPNLPDVEQRKRLAADTKITPDAKRPVLSWIDNMLAGLIFLQDSTRSSYGPHVHNIFLSRCYNCKKFAVWVHDQLVYPKAMTGPQPNPDLPANVLRDYEEAGRIVAESPRGAAALLRLAIQKLCIFLGEKGESINEDIANLVKKGLSPMIQQALDAVRVIGNEAIHPGTLDLKDDRDTAIKLFGLVNIIAEQMISTPKHVEEVYGQLPEGARKAIDKRDSKA